MTTFTRLILIRHGETEWNLAKRAQGHQDSPLTQAGLAQARAIAKRMRQTSFDALYSSDLGRALRTAQHIGDATGCAVIPEPCLRERKLGVREGLTHEEFAARLPEIFHRYHAGDPEYAVPGGESLGEFHRRAMACCEDLARRHPGQTVVAVTHGGFLSQIFRQVIGLPMSGPRAFEIFNAAFNELFYNAGEWRLATWGGIGHLREIPLDEDEAVG